MTSWRAAMLALATAAAGAACGIGAGDHRAAAPTAPARPPVVPLPAAPTPVPTPPLPPYAIESLRARPYPGGRLVIGDVMVRGQGFTRHRMTWPSGGQVMTGTIALPDGPGPFPVVVVNHGFIPPDRYWVGQDSAIFGDPMAAHGFIAVAPNWPGYAGSGPGPPGVPAIVGEVVTALDLVTSLNSMPEADTTRVAFVGHSNGAGVAEIAMVVDARVRAVVLHGPVSSDMADNARRWWAGSPGGTQGIGTPDGDPDGYRQLSPRNYFSAALPPVLIIQGTRDQDIPAAWTDATYAALQRQGVETSLRWFEGAAHDFTGADLDAAVAAQEAWIRAALNL